MPLSSKVTLSDGFMKDLSGWRQVILVKSVGYAKTLIEVQQYIELLIQTKKLVNIYLHWNMGEKMKKKP
jgi:hypothetical protein